MFENEASKKIRRGKKLKNERSTITILGFRWLMVAFVILFSIAVHKDVSIADLFPYTLAVVIIYNIIITYTVIKYKRNNIVFSLTFLYIDAFFLALFCYELGGISSDIYILFFFIIWYCGVVNKPLKTVAYSLFCVTTYTVSCIYATNHSMVELNYVRLIIRDLFIIFNTIGVSRIFYEVKKYNQLRKKEFMIARTDRLTGLANRHYFDQKVNEEIEYADSSGNPLNILMFDLDNFKGFNDTYGHVWGDKLLMLFSDIIRQNTRKTDIPVRYGGEEFLILIRDLDIFIVKSIGDRIRKQLEKQRLYAGTDGDKKRITVSCGIAQYPKHAKTLKQVIDYADKALYHAKKTGKNKVVTYDEMNLSGA